MTATDSPSDGVGLVDSMAFVEFDVDRARFRGSYDSDRDSTSLAVVTVIATALGRNPTDLPPLHSVVDTGALDALFSDSLDGARDRRRTSFSYVGFDVTVSGEGTVEAEPKDRPRPSP